MEAETRNLTKSGSTKSTNDDLTKALDQLKLGDTDDVKDQSRKSIKTGLIFDVSMTEHKCIWDENYPESPDRFSRVLDKMKQLGLVDRCKLLQPRPASKKEILYIHTEDHFEKMKITETIDDPVELEELSSKYDAVYFHPKTNELALLAAGSTIELIDAVLEDEVKNGFALIRPPGHHAFADKPCGYCFYNNIAIGAAHAVKQHGLQRVLIVDWDIHHGQATQFSFEEQDEVMYFSIHKYLNGSFWPELIESNYNSIGRGPGKGYNVNVPLNEEELTDHDYLAIFHNILLPLAYEYNPQLILISAGYDAAIGCPEGNMLLSPSLFAHLTSQLMTLAQGKVCVVLEGGYCLSSLSDGAALTLRALLGDPCPPLPKSDEPVKLHKSAVDSILDVIWAHKPQWKSLRIQEEFSGAEIIDENNPLVRRYSPVVEYRGKASLVDPPSKYDTRDCYPVRDKETFEKFESMIRCLWNSTDLTVSSSRTCIKFDFDMNSHRRPNSDHPECPDRIKSIYNGLKNKGILDNCTIIEEKRSAVDAELKLVHSDEYVLKIRLLEHMNQDQIDKVAHTFDSIYMCKNTNDAARLSVGALLQVTDQVLTNKSRNGFAIIRPPGHHAARNAASGFCIFNNIAVAVEYAIKNYNLKRVLIVDWDVHHGDGTQSIFENHPNVLFISLHRYDFASFYPNSIKSGFKTPSNIINIPWNGGPMSNFDYILAFTNIILPVAYEYNPEVVFVSAGFDAAKNDPLGEYKLDPEVFGHFTHLLSGLARGKLILALEGGYNLNAITESTANCVSVLLGEPPKPLQKTIINESARTTIRDVMSYHSSNYSSLAFYAQLPPNKLTE
ncbi:histone deacetylase 6 isoform X2 [Tetranychus urticae]|uniref:Histone deacetylase domain-containing protein n=1 Tax=Tetranychus urticae TaxID=32264 RepID=T1JVS7_TETUR|nr:histone deacetylase 6 isoform X2 [Tetranychus urticae]